MTTLTKLAALLAREQTRAYLYRVLCAVGVVLVGRNVITGAELEAYLPLVAEILGTGLASANTTTKKEHDNG